MRYDATSGSDGAAHESDTCSGPAVAASEVGAPGGVVSGGGGGGGGPDGFIVSRIAPRGGGSGSSESGERTPFGSWGWGGPGFLSAPRTPPRNPIRPFEPIFACVSDCL